MSHSELSLTKGSGANKWQIPNGHLYNLTRDALPLNSVRFASPSSSLIRIHSTSPITALARPYSFTRHSLAMMEATANMDATDKATVTLYDVILDPKAYPGSPNPWKSRHAARFLQHASLLRERSFPGP